MVIFKTKEMKWISIEDRLPEDWVGVLAYGDFTYGHFHETTHFLNGEFTVGMDQTVTHWMPLPEPPKPIN